jgi:hypothetical protein
LLAVGFLCNWLIKPVDPKHHMKAEDAEALVAVNTGGAPAAPSVASDVVAVNPITVGLAWAAVWIPIGWGVWVTLQKAVVLFR